MWSGALLPAPPSIPGGKAAPWPTVVPGSKNQGPLMSIYDSLIIDGTKNRLKREKPTRTNPTGFPRNRSVFVESVSVIAH